MFVCREQCACCVGAWAVDAGWLAVLAIAPPFFSTPNRAHLAAVGLGQLPDFNARQPDRRGAGGDQARREAAGVLPRRCLCVCVWEVLKVESQV